MESPFSTAMMATVWKAVRSETPVEHMRITTAGLPALMLQLFQFERKECSFSTADGMHCMAVSKNFRVMKVEVFVLVL